MSDIMRVILFLQHNSIVAVMLVFCLIVLWAYWPSNRKKLDQQGYIPLDDDR